jgi:dienelactone hydrolase
MHSVRFTTETSSNGVLERDFIVGDVPGVLWSPVAGSDHAPLVLMGHGGGLHKKTSALMARAHDTVTTWGFTVAAIDAPGHGDRPRTAEDEQARADLRQALAAGDTERFQLISVRYVTSLAERAVPEWQATMDALQQLPEIGTEATIGYGGGISLGTAIGILLTAIEPRITAAIFGGGFVVHEALIEAARRITVPVQFLLPWDDEHVDRQSALALFDAFASKEKTLHANPGDHRTIRWVGVDREFRPRHLARAGAPPACPDRYRRPAPHRTPIPPPHLAIRRSRYAGSSP